MNTKSYYVYILSNRRRTVLYTGVTNNLVRRVWEHENKLVDGFTKKYNVSDLIYYEIFDGVDDAINREKQVKDYRREKKLLLIRKMNPSLSRLELSEISR